MYCMLGSEPMAAKGWKAQWLSRRLMTCIGMLQGAAGPLRKAQALQHLPVPPINMLQPAQAASAPPASAWYGQLVKVLLYTPCLHSSPLSCSKPACMGEGFMH